MPKRKEPQQRPISLISNSSEYKRVIREELPPGKLRMVITYLEMKKPQAYSRVSHRVEKLSIIRTHDPNAKFYRFLYDSVGQQWLWYERAMITDNELEEIIKNPKVHIYVLYVNGTPAGFSELDYRVDREVQIAYFGLIPEFTGRSLGSYFLRWSVEKAWSQNPDRVWVHTCNFDSPHAIATYQKAGFSAYLQEEKIIDDPRMIPVHCN